MSMLRLARRSQRSDLVRLLVSVRTPADLYYAAELPGPESTVIYTRLAPPGNLRPTGRLNLADVTGALVPGSIAYVCGSAGFADSATDLLMAAGVGQGIFASRGSCTG